MHKLFYLLLIIGFVVVIDCKGGGGRGGGRGGGHSGGYSGGHSRGGGGKSHLLCNSLILLT